MFDDWSILLVVQTGWESLSLAAGHILQILCQHAHVLLLQQCHPSWVLPVVRRAGEHAHVCVCRRACEIFTLAQVFAPLARLLGLYSIKEELEALSFMYSDPEAYATVQRRLDALAKQQGDVVLSVSLECFA